MRHRWTFLRACGLAALFGFGDILRGDDPAKPEDAKPTATAISKDEQDVRARMKAMVEAYNQNDAKAVATFWSENAEYVAFDGARLKGRDQVEKHYAKTLAANKGIKIDSVEMQYRFVTPDVAIGEGTARLSRPGETAETSSMMTVNVRKNGEWYLDSVHETVVAVPPSHFDELKDLEWFIGQWVDASDDATIEHKVEWVKNHNFIIDSFVVTVAGSTDMQGTQIIGWDPANNTIRSWFFDTDGGFGEGRWTKTGKRWTVKATGTTPDGLAGVATHVYTEVDKDTYLWKSIGRKIGNDFQPNIEEVKVVRKAERK